jgi:hypothetical protein
VSKGPHKHPLTLSRFFEQNPVVFVMPGQGGKEDPTVMSEEPSRSVLGRGQYVRPAAREIQELL